MKVPEIEEEVAVAAVRIVEDKLSPEEEKELWVYGSRSMADGQTQKDRQNIQNQGVKKG